MKWSYRLLSVAGIDIKIHVTFFLILLLFGVQWGVQHGGSGVLFGVVLALLLFVCVTLHELGHSLVAQALSIPVREIILLPLGGLALLSRKPERPRDELLIAVAGPLVNVVIAIVLYLVLLPLGGLVLLDTYGMIAGANAVPSLLTLLSWLLEANIFLVLFNMLPAFPLDGGRILRAILAMGIGQRRATSIASRVGQIFAVLLGVLGLLSLNIFLILIAVFIYMGAGQENIEGQTSMVLSTQRVGDAYNKHVLTLTVGDRVQKVLEYVLASYQPDFAVLQGSRLLGVVTRDDALRALATGPAHVYVPDTYVTTIMRRDVVRVEAHQTLDEVRQVMNEHSVRVVAVYEGDAYLGLVNMEDIAEAFTVLTFLERYQRTHPQPDAPSVPDGEEHKAG